MSRSVWMALLAAIAMALMPGVALAADRSHGASAHHSQQQAASKAAGGHRVAVLGLGSGFVAASREVRSLQAGLAAAGFSPGPVDGRFGRLTEAAVARYQRADGLVVDGIVGPRTRHALAGGGLLPGSGWLEPHGSGRVRSLQRRLARAGFSPGLVDGRYGPRTARAVRRYQHARHLPVTGIASLATLRALAHNPSTGTLSHRHPAASHRPTSKQPTATPKSKHHRTPTLTIGHPKLAPARPSLGKHSGSPWSIVLLALAAAVGLLAVSLLFSLRDRKPPTQTPDNPAQEPHTDQPATTPHQEQPVTTPHPDQPSAAPHEEQPAATAVAEDPAAASTNMSSAVQIAALEAAVAMPSARSPQRNDNHTTNHNHGAADTPAPLPVDKPQPVKASQDRCERVKALQRQLAWLGFKPGIVDGRYGPITTEAVRCFQEVRGLPVNGVADPTTLTALRAGTPERPFSGRVQRVEQLQRELTLRGFDPGTVDGRYGPQTTEAVKRFQRTHQLPDDGIADHHTLAKLHTPKPTPHNRRQQRVKQLQTRLDILGLNPGPIDGHYGPHTTEAVKRFQQAHQLPIDGVADPVTLNTLTHSTTHEPPDENNTTPPQPQPQLTHTQD